MWISSGLQDFNIGYRIYRLFQTNKKSQKQKKFPNSIPSPQKRKNVVWQHCTAERVECGRIRIFFQFFHLFLNRCSESCLDISAHKYYYIPYSIRLVLLYTRLFIIMKYPAQPFSVR
uniref:Uncharacterized protein n=1 Tax=Cacopsylla melanoneura TaxID=428564 RepID=A0A8D8YUB2_9HEMI